MKVYRIKGKYRHGVLENMIMMKICGPKRDVVIGDWKKKTA
jgi:hypothetical protein